MNSFERGVLSDNGIPFEEAADWFIAVRQPHPSAQEKTAGLTDAPDEEGELEGQFAVPKETVVSLIQVVVTQLMTLLNASLAYEFSIRGPSSDPVKRAISCGDYQYRHVIEVLMKRGNALAGAVHVGDTEPPPALTEPVEVAKSLIRGNQELIAALRGLKEACGENPLCHTVCQFMTVAQERIDDLWRAMDPAAAAPPLPELLEEPGAPVEHDESAESPEDEAEESPEVQAAEQEAGTEQHAPAEPPQVEELSEEEAQPPPDEKAASVRVRFLTALKKLANEPGATMESEAPMAAQTPTPELQPANYMQAEQLGQQLQQGNEAQFFRQRAQEAEQGTQVAQSQIDAMGQQLAQLQQQAAMAAQTIQQHTQEAMAAQDAALQQTQIAANMRMGMQKLRAQMMEVASQDPAEVAASELQGQPMDPMAQEGVPGEPTAPPGKADKEVNEAERAKTEAAEQEAQAAEATGAPDMQAADPEPGGGPAGMAPPPGSAPTAAPPGGGLGMGQPSPMGAAGGGGAAISTAMPQQAVKIGNAKLANLMAQASQRLPWALAGAGLGAAHSDSTRRSAPELRSKVRDLQEGEQGGFFNAMRLAAMKAQSAGADVAEQHPRASMALGALGGAATGAVAGPAIAENVRTIGRNLKDLR